MPRQLSKPPSREELLEACLHAFLKAGTVELSLDQLGQSVGISKRMLIHYFGRRENIEHGAIKLLEERLRQQFVPTNFPGVFPETVVMHLWQRTTARESRPMLLLVMDISRQAWSGDERAFAFYEEQQRLWTELLLKFIPNRQRVEEVLQVFQGATLAFLITGDPEPGRRALLRVVEDLPRTRKRR